MPSETVAHARRASRQLACWLSRVRKSDRSAHADENQLPLFVDPAKELLAQLASTKVEELSPMQAFEL